jgi:quinolinate synthase
MRLNTVMVEKRKAEFPDAVFMAHPECQPEIVALADQVLSTGGMLRFAHETDAVQIIVGTEQGIIHRLEKENPDKMFIPLSEQAVCPNMKLIELHDVLNALETMTNRITLDEDTIKRAAAPIMKMLEFR